MTDIEMHILARKAIEGYCPEFDVTTQVHYADRGLRVQMKYYGIDFRSGVNATFDVKTLSSEEEVKVSLKLMCETLNRHINRRLEVEFGSN
jgi:hypothetical protein